MRVTVDPTTGEIAIDGLRFWSQASAELHGQAVWIDVPHRDARHVEIWSEFGDHFLGVAHLLDDGGFGDPSAARAADVVAKARMERRRDRISQALGLLRIIPEPQAAPPSRERQSAHPAISPFEETAQTSSEVPVRMPPAHLASAGLPGAAPAYCDTPELAQLAPHRSSHPDRCHSCGQLLPIGDAEQPATGQSPRQPVSEPSI